MPPSQPCLPGCGGSLPSEAAAGAFPMKGQTDRRSEFTQDAPPSVSLTSGSHLIKPRPPPAPLTHSPPHTSPGRPLLPAAWPGVHPDTRLESKADGRRPGGAHPHPFGKSRPQAAQRLVGQCAPQRWLNAGITHASTCRCSRQSTAGRGDGADAARPSPEKRGACRRQCRELLRALADLFPL